MSCDLQLQRNTEVFFSTVDLKSGAAVTTMTPSNTWKVEVLAGYAVSQATATQDITALESGTTPDRSTTRFNTAINPVDWNFQTYVRPTGARDTDADDAGGPASSNVKPLADWYLWQSLFSNAAPAVGAEENSAWQDGGVFDTVNRATTANVAAHNSNFGSALEQFLYIKMDNVVYQISDASVNEATTDAAIDAIATTTWTGFGNELDELTGLVRNNAIAVFGGVLNDGSTITANSNFAAVSQASAYHPWETYNIAGTTTTAAFIKNRLSTIDIFHTPEGGAAVNYTFPVTTLSWSWNNNITFLTPEELNKLNTPIGNFTGARNISGSLAAYLRPGDPDTAQLLRNILDDSRVSHSIAANANIKVGGSTAPFMAFYMPAVQYELPVHNIEDIISVTVNYQAQEPVVSCGNGGEVVVFVSDPT